MDISHVAKNTQEQATAAWTSSLNQMRIDSVMEKMRQEFEEQDVNLADAVREMAKALRGVNAVIANNDGGTKGVHGNIAEVAEAGVRNARNIVGGDSATYKRLADYSRTDLLRGSTEIQMKFSVFNDGLSLHAVQHHLEAYPDYVSEGGKYVIPRDHYEAIKRLYEMTEKEAARLTRSGDGLKPKQWTKVHEFFRETGLSMDDIEPAAFDYAEVQRDAIHDTLRRERTHLKDVHNERRGESRKQAASQGAPTLHEAVNATAVSAAIEGGAAFTFAIVSKLKAGKRIRDLDKDDWSDILSESGKGTLKGGMRGASVYFLSSVNLSEYVASTFSLSSQDALRHATASFTSASGALASSFVTASFGVAEQAHLMRTGVIDEAEFLERSEVLCLDASVIAISSFVGQALIPVPVLGAIIGSTTGNILYQIAKDGLNKHEQAITRAYAEMQRELDSKLEARYQTLVAQLNDGMQEYLILIEKTLSPDSFEAFEGSILLAQYLGVPDTQLLKTSEEIDRYFLA